MKRTDVLKRGCPTLIIGLLSLSAMLLGCDIENEHYVRVLLPPGSPPIFLISEDANFNTPSKIYRLSVYRVGDEFIEQRIYWDLDVGSKGKGFLSTPNPAVEISIMTYGVVPDGIEELTAARPLVPGIEYCVEVSGPDFKTVVTECFTYQP